MSCTRDKNQPGNYEMEQNAMKKERQSILYPHSYNGHAYQTCLPGQGLLPARIGSAQLSNNYVDIESRLYGISSNNLVKPLAPVTPELKTIPSLSMYKVDAVMAPPEFVPLTSQRLRLVHSD